MSNFWKSLSCVSRIFSSIYFFIVYQTFSLINYFKRKQQVSPISGEILLQSATALAFKIRQGELTSEGVVNAFIERCREVQPILNAIVQENFENALNEAKRVDQLISNGSAPSSDDAPFLGVPFTLKDAFFVDGIGSDIGGSIRMPAYFSGIFGHKTSGSVVSYKGAYPECHDYQKHMCVVGPMCRYADDLLPMLSVLAGPNVKKMSLNKKVDLSELKIFYMDEIDSSLTPCVDYELKGALQKVIKYFDKKYNVLSYKLDLSYIHWAFTLWMNAMESDTCPTFAQEMTDCQGEINPFLELGKWTVCQSVHTFPAILLAMVEKLQKVLVNDDDQRKLKHMREHLTRQLECLLSENAIFLFPPHATLTPYHNLPCWMPFNWTYTGIFNAMALPVTFCPMGLSRDDTPLGVQIVGAMHQDHLTIAVAQELEKAFGGWTPPGRRQS